VDCKACKLIRDDRHINAHARGPNELLLRTSRSR
jgi:hypothetical protein